MTEMNRETDKGVVVKSLGALEIKSEEKGEVEAVVARFNVVDHEGDVILDTAIPDGAGVKMSSYSHDLIMARGEKPVGKGRLYGEDGDLVFRGRLFLQTQSGRETFEVLKEMGNEQEWSFGFYVVGAEVPSEEWKKKGAERILTKLDCFEVSPVLRGAGIGTRTLAVKEQKPCDTDPPEPTPEEIAAKEAEDKAIADQKAADEAKAVELKAVEDARVESEQKERAKQAVEDFHRVQRTFKRLRLV